MQLSPTDLITLSRLLDEAIDLEPEQVDGWLAGLSAEHEHLRTRLQQMLAAHWESSNEGFMVGGPRLADTADETVARTGDLVGPYRLIREIGRGGMGAVWLAERADGTLKRHVALKLPRLAWGAGLSERMARERDIGALLEHPNIARLYDAGVDTRGRPYLALQYIDGQPLDTWCEAQGLSIRDRLRLFVQVARAVAYAHGRLVVHRDLKPSNVLVTADGQAHLLDFGIAKLLHEVSPGDDQLTQEQGRVLTPHYASPEQIKGETITVASDVYSLGVLLYELLTGRYPHEPQSKSLAAIEEATLNDEPPMASGRAFDRATAKAMRGEIDAILAKALKRDAAQRYATVDAFAEDIERHLMGDVVQARPDSFGYRVSKAIRRHWVGVGASLAILLAVLTGSALALAQAQRAAKAAERERIVKAFVADVFRVNSRVNPTNAAARPASSQSLLQGGAELIGSRFAGQPDIQAELYGVVGGVFSEMGAYKLAADYSARQLEALELNQARPRDKGKALLVLTQAIFDDQHVREAESRAKRALELLQGDSSDELDALELLARIQIASGQIEGAAATLDDADRRLESHGTAPSTARAWGVASRARLLMLRNRLDESVPLFEKAIAMAHQAEGPLSTTAVSMQLTLANQLAQTDSAAVARQNFENAISTLDALGGPHAVRAAMASARFHWRLYAGGGNGTFEQSIDALQASRAKLAAAPIPIPAWFVQQVEFWLGSLKVESGDVAGGLPLMDGSIATLSSVIDSPLERFYLAGPMGNALMYAGRHELADKWLREELDSLRKAGGANHPYAATSYHHVAENLMMQGRYAEAEAILDEAPHFEEIRGYGSDVGRYGRFLVETRAQVLLARGDATSALKLIENDPPRIDLPSGDDGFERTRTLLGEVLCSTGRQSEGVSMLKRWLTEDERTTVFPNAPWLARLRAISGLCALEVGDRAFALRNSGLARAALVAQPGVSVYYRRPAERLAQRLKVRSAPTK